MNEKKIACVIVNYNDYQRTLSLANKMEQYSSINCIIVVDNCSTDESRDVIRTYKSNKFIYIEADKNGGYGYGNNLGIYEAKKQGANHVLIANPDVVISEECILHMLQTMLDTPKCALIGAREVCLGAYAWKYTSDLHDILSASLCLNKILKKRYYTSDYYANKEKAKVDVVPGCLLLVDIELMLQHGMYDEEFFLYEEEKIIFKKLADAGYDSYVDLMVSYEHHHVDSALTIKKMMIGKKRLLKSKWLFLKKYRKVSPVMLFFANMFFGATYLEMILYACVRRLKESAHD